MQFPKSIRTTKQNQTEPNRIKTTNNEYGERACNANVIIIDVLRSWHLWPTLPIKLNVQQKDTTKCHIETSFQVKIKREYWIRVHTMRSFSVWLTDNLTMHIKFRYDAKRTLGSWNQSRRSLLRCVRSQLGYKCRSRFSRPSKMSERKEWSGEKKNDKFQMTHWYRSMEENHEYKSIALSKNRDVLAANAHVPSANKTLFNG